MFIAGGCSFIALEKDLHEIETLATVKGFVTSSLPVRGPLVAVLVQDENMQPRIVDFQSFAIDKGFIFIVPPDDYYRIFIYEDENGDENYQPTERIVQSASLDLDRPGLEMEVILDLPVVTREEMKQRVMELKSQALIKVSEERIRFGSLIDLKDSVFDEKNVQMGFWQRLTFIKEIPFGLFF